MPSATSSLGALVLLTALAGGGDEHSVGGIFASNSDTCIVFK